MEFFDNMEAAQEIADLLKAGNKDGAEELIERMVDDFAGITGFIADLRAEKDQYAGKTCLSAAQVEWIANTMEAAWSA